MKKFFAIVEREVVERWQLPLGAALLGLLVWLAAWLPQVRRIPFAEVRSGAALAMTAVLLAGAAVALGVLLMSRSLGEGRLAFYYVRPVGAATLWCGKLAAALLLLAASGLLLWLPTLLAGGSPSLALDLLVDWPRFLETLFLPPAWGDRGFVLGPVMDRLRPFERGLSPGSPWLWVALALTFLLLASHALAVALRSRSPRILADGVLLGVVAALGWSAVTRLVAHAALGTLYRSVAVLAGVVLAALFAAALAQTAAGRTSPTRAHAVLSAVLWSILLLVFLGWEIVSRQVVRAGLEDLAVITHFEAPPAGDWIVVGGPARGGSGYAPVFAVHPATGERRKIGMLQGMCGAPMFSADGSKLVWASSSDGVTDPARRCEIRYLDLSSPRERARATAIFTPHWPANPFLGPLVELGPEGRRLAAVEKQRLTLYALPSGATLTAVRLPPDGKLAATPRFVAGQVRIHSPRWEDGAMDVWELDPATNRLASLGHILGFYGAYDPAGEHLATWGRSVVRIHRAADLQQLSRIDVGDGWYVADLRFLEGSGFVIAEHSKYVLGEGIATTSMRVRRFDAAAQEVWRLNLSAYSAVLGAEPARGRLWLGVRLPRASAGSVPWVSRLLDLDSGRVVLERPGFVPSWYRARTGSAGSRILLDARGAPFAVNLETAASEPLVKLAGD